MFPLLKTLLQYLLFPAVLMLSTGVMILGINHSASIEGLALLVASSTILIVHLAERVVPFREEWNRNLGDVKADLTSLAIILTLLNPLTKLSSTWLVSLLLLTFGDRQWLTLFPNDWPLLSQLALFAVIAEFGRYWIHRWSHVQKHLWHVHASHHCSERLYQFNGYRIHPINYLWNFFLGQFPLIALGANQEVILLYFVFSSVVAAFQHANINSKNGFLNLIISTNELHRWHHTTDATVGNKNFGSALILWDMVFGSYYDGKNRILDKVGLISPGNYPINHFLKQIAAPFCWQRCVVQVNSTKPD